MELLPGYMRRRFMRAPLDNSHSALLNDRVEAGFFVNYELTIQARSLAHHARRAGRERSRMKL